ncbi:MAG: Rpn family recombination-promoting nuclease/putative transposase [Kluyvera sp.]|uniref:Rpn family recombination-promoting nuclease/putative transposase n=1 Tax=Kluyvera sp. TaxID=1538228 RepID=UPI003F397ABB
MPTTVTPHDAVFKTFLSRAETARDFITLHLPSTLIKLCKLETLKLESGSFIEDDLRPYYSDIIYSLRTTTGRGYIHVLIEHQSTPDKHMAFRLLRYAVAAMQRHLDAGHKKLPLVIPILFYHGKRTPYPWTLNWLDEFSDPDSARQLYGSAFPLVDITVIPDDEIMRHHSMAALTLVQKHIRLRDMAQLEDKLASLFVLGQLSGQQITALVNYLIQAGQARDVQKLLYGLAQRVPEHGEQFMTMAEQLKLIGRKEGIKEGIQEGKRTATQEMAKAMLERGLDSHIIMDITGFSQDELQKLTH